MTETRNADEEKMVCVGNVHSSYHVEWSWDRQTEILCILGVKNLEESST